MLAGGTRFVHPEHGECAVLPRGEWAFEVPGRDTLEPHVYYQVMEAHVKEEIIVNEDMWDKAAGIKHDRSHVVRALIRRSARTPQLTSKYEPTVELRLARFMRHPLFYDEWRTKSIATELKAADISSYKEGKRAAADIRSYIDQNELMARGYMRTLVTQLALLADCVRSCLAPTRPRFVEPGATRAEASTLDVHFDENGGMLFECLLRMSGFVPSEELETAWVPACAGATEALLGAHAHPTGVNPLRRAWFFARGDLRAWRGDAAAGDGLSPHDASDAQIYDAAERELGDRARDDEGSLPAYLLRQEMEELMIAAEDARIKAHAEVIPDTVTVMFENKTIAAPGARRLVIGAVAQVRFEWNGWSRKDSPGDTLMPHFKQHVARAIARGS